MKGIVLILLTAVATAVISPVVFMTVGEGMAPPGPIPSHYAIIWWCRRRSGSAS